MTLLFISYLLNTSYLHMKYKLSLFLVEHDEELKKYLINIDSESI